MITVVQRHEDLNKAMQVLAEMAETKVMLPAINAMATITITVSDQETITTVRCNPTDVMIIM
ncbi:hypothetical protein D3C72_2289160 [compost metagenome]